MRILLITYNFLQYYNASSIQARRFFLELAENGHRITVLTNKEKNTFKFQHKNIEVIEIFSIKKKFGFKLASILKLWELNFMPDWDLLLWNPFVWFKLFLLRKEKFDFVHTISAPASTQLIPLLWKNKGNTKWIAQFYDPWVDNSYIKLRFLFFQKLNLYFEKMVAQNADLIIHTNRYVENHWNNRYGETFIKNKLILPLCIKASSDGEGLKQFSNENGKITISHIGSIYGKRNLNALIDALNILFNQDKTLFEKLSVDLVGFLLATEISKIKKLDFAFIFNFIGEVPYVESLNYMVKSSLLVLIEEESDESLFFPSKLTDYLSLQKPILGIVPKNCVSRDILQQNGHFCFEYSDIDGIANYIKIFPNIVNSPEKINSKVSELYTENVITTYLEAILRL